MEANPTWKNIYLRVLLQNVDIRYSADGACGYEIRSRFPGGILHETRDSALYIIEKVFSPHRIFRLCEFLRDADKAGIRLWVPKDSPLNTISVKNISGKTTIRGIHCRTLEVGSSSGMTAIAASGAKNFKARQTSGRLILDGCVMENAEVATSSGTVEMENTRTQGLRISATSGNAEFSGVASGSTEIKTTSGRITLEIADKKQNYDVDIEVQGGRIFLDGLKQAGRKLASSRQGGNGRNTLRLKTTSGDAGVRFL